MGDKITSKSEDTQKEPLDERKKDRGDNLKKQDSIKHRNDLVNVKVTSEPPLAEQGDVPAINKVTKISKKINSTNKVTSDKLRKQNDIKPKLSIEISSKVSAGAEKGSLEASENITAPNKARVLGKNISDKVSVRPKVLSNITQLKDATKIGAKTDVKTDRIKKQPSLKSRSKEIISVLLKPDSTKPEPEVKKEVTPHRKPMIKTVKSKNDNRVYKAVTFAEQKLMKPTVLEINIPNIQAKKTKLVDKNLEAKPASVQGAPSKINLKPQLNRRNRITDRTKPKKLNRCISSPDKFKKSESPPTEVAKWAPSCLNNHTKPYYEAWVNTTLAAISKISKKDKLFFEKQKIIKTFQESLELGTESPDLIHEHYKDEYYTGKIKIKQKNLSKKARQPLITPLIDTDY